MKSLALKIWLSVALVALLGYTGFSLWHIARGLAESPPTAAASPTLAPVDLGSFKMTERSGREMTLSELRGQVWVASMFFASCPHECLQLNRTIAALQKDPLFDGARFASITVDPASDTPEMLRQYANTFAADPQRWLFLRGTLGDVGRFGDAVKVAAGYKVHTRRLVLFDRRGVPRGAFQSDDAQDMQRLRSLVPQLLKEKAD